MKDDTHPQRLKLSLIVICLAFSLGCGSQGQDTSSNPKKADQAATKAPVNVAVVTKGAVQSWISLTGTLLPIRESRVGTKVAGRIAEIFVDEGDAVNEGDALFVLEQRDFLLAKNQAEHNLDAAKANLSAARINLANARREFKRLKGLRASNAVSQQEFDTASDAFEATRAAVKVAEASVDVARDTLEMVEHNLAESTVRSPISGHIARRNINVGEVVSPVSPAPCFYVVDDTVCKVEAHLPDMKQSSVSMSQQVKITVDGVPGRAFSGGITHIGETIDPLSRTLTIRARVANPDGVLRPGALARLKILCEERTKVVTAPIRCVVKRNGNPTVFVVSSGVAVARWVTLGLSGDEKVEIIDGLAPDDLVVIDGTESLEDGMAVEIVNPDQIE